MKLLKKLVGRRSMAASNDDAVSDRSQLKSFSYRPSSLVTSTVFDNDDTFSTVAQAILCRYEQEGFSEFDAICGILVTGEHKRQFLESLELRFVSNSNCQAEELSTPSPVSELVERVRFVLGDTLKEIWRELDRSESTVSSTEPTHCDSDYQCPLKTPRNTLHSPMKSSSEITNNGCSSEGRNQQRRFFPEVEPQPINRPCLRWEFQFSSSGPPVQSLQLDGLEQRSAFHGSYSPPSPISMKTRSL